MLRHVDSALRTLNEIVAEQIGERSVPSMEELFRIVLMYERRQFDVPDVEDADGFLFQYGTVTWNDEEKFSVGFARQFAFADESCEELSLVQIEFCYACPPDGHLQKMSGADSWWFRGSGVLFTDWLNVVRSDPVWNVIRNKEKVNFVRSQDVAC